MKVNTENVDEKYKPLVAENMSRQDISMLGVVILKDKFENFKYKIKNIFRRKHEKEKV